MNCPYCGNTELLDPNIYKIPGFTCGTYANAPRPGGRKCWEGYFIKSQAELAALKKRLEEAEELLYNVSHFRQNDMGHRWLRLVGRAETFLANKEKP